MFEKEIKFISDFCLNKISKAGSFLTFEKLKGIEIHPAILKFISTEIDFQVYKDRQVLLQKSSFDYSGAEISKYFKMIALEIKKSRRISENEINNLITQAVTFNFNFTTKPNETLINFIYGEEQNLSPDDLAMRLEYPYYYGYLRQILLSYLDKKQLLNLDRKEFEFLLSKIDSELFPVKTNELVDNALDAISDFFNIGAVLRFQIPVQSIELYLKEKQLNTLAAKLERANTQSPRAKYEVDEIKKIIYSDIDVTEKKVETSQDETPSVDGEVAVSNQNISVSENMVADTKQQTVENLTPSQQKPEVEKIELEDLELVNPDAKPPIDLSEKISIEEDIETFPLDTDEIEEPILENQIEEIDTDASVKQDVLSFLSKREIEKIIGTIFNEDKEDFATTIETISECKTYEKAADILKSLYTTYNVNPYSREAIVLTNAVAKYFTNA
jgi:hypothetical protein